MIVKIREDCILWREAEVGYYILEGEHKIVSKFGSVTFITLLWDEYV